MATSAVRTPQTLPAGLLKQASLFTIYKTGNFKINPRLQTNHQNLEQDQQVQETQAMLNNASTFKKLHLGAGLQRVVVKNLIDSFLRPTESTVNVT